MAQKLAPSNFKKAVRRAKRDSWRSFVESTSSLTATARLVKIIRNNETVRVSNVIKHDGEFTKSPLETMNYLLDILSPGSQQTENHTTRSDLVDNPFVRPEETEMIASICSLERMEAAINEFQPFKAPGPDGLYPVLLQEGWNQLKEYYHVIFQACLRHSYVPMAWKEGTGIFLPKPGKESYFEAKSFRMITLTSFQLKWLERLILYHINDDKNVQAKLSASQYGFRAGVSTETALHEFVRRVEQCLVRKKPALGIFLDIGAFDNVTFRGFATALRGLGMSEILTSWIENLLRHRTVQVELYGDKVKTEVMKGNPQGGILSPFLWNCVLNNLLLELRSRGFYVQAYADDLAILVTGADMLWIRGMAQKAINIAANWASEQELQFSSKKTEIVLFTHKRNPDLGSLTMNGSKLELSKEAKLLGVTLDSKLTWKPHITRITRKATTALMQCRQIVGKTWGIKPSIMKWIYTAVIRPIMSYACVSWAGGLNKQYLVRKLTKVQRLACLMISSAFPGTSTGALEILLNITPIEEFLLAEAVRGSYRISVSGHWHAKPVGSFGKTKSHVDICNEARRFLPLLQMPADRIKKTKVFERNFECQIMDKQNAIRSESILNHNTIRVYTDGSKLDGRVGAGFYAEYPNNSPKQAFFHLGIHSTVFQAEVLAISEVAKNLHLEQMHNQNIVVLVDSQAAIKALIKSTVTSITVLNCIRSLNQLGKQNHVSIAWIPGHAGVHGNEVADYVAKSGSKSIMYGPEPFITVPYASCVSTVTDWSTARWKSMWNKRKDCLRMKETVDWTSSRLTIRLLNLKRPQLNRVVQVLTGHCNLQRHKKTTGRAESSLCPKCSLEDETPNHHVGNCKVYQDIRVKYFGTTKTTVHNVVTKCNINKLATYLKEAGRLSEIDQ